jgi:penicillin amidase
MRKLLVTLLCLVWLIQTVSSQNRASSADDLAGRARAALSQISGRIEIEGLIKPVEVLRDRWGVAHIYAETVDDLFFAQGFVAAQDRLWQMEMWRRTGEGKLSEILGPSAIERDRFARLMRYRGPMEAEWTSYAPDARQIIEAFVRGVNAVIEASRDNPPIEFQLTGIKPEPWTSEVCLTRMAGYVMTRNASTEVLRAQLARLAGTEKTDELMPTDPVKKLEIPAGLDLEGIDEKVLGAASAASGPVRLASVEGSNNWVIGGLLTRSGKPILANDPHRPIALPSLRYIVHLVGPGWNVIGAGEPALPGVAAGHNERVGFGFTIVGIDQQDIYVEETDASDPNLYRYQGRWERMKTEREEIKVKVSAEPEAVELRFTRHGPVIHEDRARRRAYVLRWVGTEPGTAGYLASLSMNRAKNWKEFLAALERWKVPSENLVYADTDGNIGWQAAGLAPVRRGWSGLLPVPGDGRFEWQGFLPLSKLPRLYYPAYLDNPASKLRGRLRGLKLTPRYVTRGGNYIATANHNILPKNYKHEVGFEWAAPFRFNAIQEILNSISVQAAGVENSEWLQNYEMSLPAREIVPLLLGAKVEDARLREAVDLLIKWDPFWSSNLKEHQSAGPFSSPPRFILSRDSAAAALFEVWLTKLTPNVFKPRVPAEVWPLISGRISVSQLIAELKKGTKNPVGVDAQTLNIMLRSLDEAVSDLSERLGPDIKKWRWGDLHFAEFKHMLSRDDATRAVFDLGRVPRGGDANTVNATGGPELRQTSGASFREILDLSDWDNSVAINVPGQSGQPGSKHYADLLPLWAEGKYFPLLYSRKKIEQHTANRLVLEPIKVTVRRDSK